ncbi:MAG: flagellar FlbD family protein [Acidobacteriaceae bacterium]
MIHLTRLNRNPLVVNSDLIKYAESSPDTMLTLVNGEKIVVLESCEDVVNRTIAYRVRVFGESAAYLQALAWTPAPIPAPEPSPRNSANPTPPTFTEPQE